MSQGDTGDEDAVIDEAMAASATPAGGPAVPAARMFRGGRRRRRTPGGRPHQVSVRLTAEEFEAVSLRAAAARVSVPHYLALRALDSITPTGMDSPELRAWTMEMFNLRAELNKVGVNVAAERTRTPGGEPVAADLQSRVRAAAHAATGEAEFLEQLHAQGVVVRPRFAAGDSTTVVGMSVALPTGDTGNTLDWHGAGTLGKDLSLPALRERWGQTPEQQGAAVEVWRQVGAVGKRPSDRGAAVGVSKRPENAEPDFATAVADINTLGAYAAGLGGDDPEAAREAARQAAAVLAAAALRAHGPSGGAIGSAARRMARCAQDPRSGPATGEVIPARAVPKMSLTSAALLNAATGKAQHAGWVAVFHALARTAQAVAAAQRSQHAAAWETHAATQAAQRVLEYAGRMDAAVTAATAPPPAAPTPDDGLTEAERKVRDVMAGRRTKTIRQIVDNATTSTTRANRGQGGKKHDRGRGGPRR